MSNYVSQGKYWMQKIYIKGVNKNAPGTNYDQQHSNGTLVH